MADESCACLFYCVRHFEPNGTHWNQVGSAYILPITGPLGYQGLGTKLSRDGLTVLDGNPLFTTYAGDAALYARASTALVGGVDQQQFQLRVRHVPIGAPFQRVGTANALNGDGTQIALGSQYHTDHSGRGKQQPQQQARSRVESS